jgi:TolB-like protein/Tfp pilus assembly protein PilF
VTDASHAVFLSYASQDAEAAQRICAALRAVGIEVFLDQSELQCGDAWDKKIQHEIHSCALFIPIISQFTQERLEGYFRREWKLAIERTRDMADQKAFLVPVVIDDTGDRNAIVPDEFRNVQWTRLPAGETPPGFVARIQKLLSGERGLLPGMVRDASRASTKSSVLLPAGLAVLLTAVGTYLLFDKPWSAKSATFAPPAHSIAVLPFVNMSGDKEQEYFSDGLTEELLNSVSQINELQVAARTSAFSFKGTNTDIGTIARKLNVGAVLEGSVRRSGNTVRITAQLINAATGFHLWSRTYDRDLGDVLMLETEIASDVAGALKVSLLGDEATKIELGGTRNPAAFDAYLRGRKAYLAEHGNKDRQTAIAAFTDAIRLDPYYALAYASRSIALAGYANEATGPEVLESFDRAQEDARKAIALAPDLAEGHGALAFYFEIGALDFKRANEEYERSLALAPGNVRMLRNYGSFAAVMGRSEAGIAALRRAVVLDPLNRNGRFTLGRNLYLGRQYKEAIAAYEDTLALDPEDAAAPANRGLAYYAQGDLERARVSCESKPDYWGSQQCLAVTYDKLGRHADAEGMLAKIRASAGETAAYQYATIYAQWGDGTQALEWLNTAIRLRDPGLEQLKTDPLMDPLRRDPSFQAALLQLKFP